MKDIVNYEGLYAITESGEVWSYFAKRFLKQYPNNKGYMRVSLCKNNKQKNFRVHRLVA